jgi:site-specific DNA-methyltransferase (adenine-specific)
MLGYISPNWSEKATHSRGYADHDAERFAEIMGGAWTGMLGASLAVAFCSNRTMHQMVTAAEAVGWQVMDYLVFVSATGVAKSTTTLKPGHELAVLMRTAGPKPQINPDWKHTNAYAIPKPKRRESPHLTTKPLAWMEALVEDFTQPGDVVLDPFMGSGTTLVAAKAEGRSAIGIEIEERYCEIAAKRLAPDTEGEGT